jgi:hypothetical protein
MIKERWGGYFCYGSMDSMGFDRSAGRLDFIRLQAWSIGDWAACVNDPGNGFSTNHGFGNDGCRQFGLSIRFLPEKSP